MMEYICVKYFLSFLMFIHDGISGTSLPHCLFVYCSFMQEQLPSEDMLGFKQEQLPSEDMFGFKQEHWDMFR